MSKAPVVPPEATPLEAFLNGQAVRAQEYLGAHPDQVDGQEGYRFRVYESIRSSSPRRQEPKWTS